MWFRDTMKDDSAEYITKIKQAQTPYEKDQALREYKILEMKKTLWCLFWVVSVLIYTAYRVL